MSNEASQSTKNKRAPIWVAFKESCAVLMKASRDKEIKLRNTDIATSNLVRVAIALSFVLIMTALVIVKHNGFYFLLVADMLCLAAIGVYVVSRFGILRAMNPHHALVCWQLMVGMSLFAVVATFNIVFVIISLLVGPYLAS